MVERLTPERDRGLENDLHRVVSLGNRLYPPKVLVIPRKRWLRPDMIRKLFTGTLSLNINIINQIHAREFKISQIIRKRKQSRNKDHAKRVKLGFTLFLIFCFKT